MRAERGERRLGRRRLVGLGRDEPGPSGDLPPAVDRLCGHLGAFRSGAGHAEALGPTLRAPAVSTPEPGAHCAHHVPCAADCRCVALVLHFELIREVGQARGGAPDPRVGQRVGALGEEGIANDSPLRIPVVRGQLRPGDRGKRQRFRGAVGGPEHGP